MAQAPGFHANPRFDHSANDSPRSGGSKHLTPIMWAGIVAAVVALTIWFAIGM